MITAPVHLAGERLMLDPAGALFWPAPRLLAVSDLHLEKGSSYARQGQLLPPWDTHATLDRLASPCCSAATSHASSSLSATASTTPTARPASPRATCRASTP
jgi:hypothetical protein